MSGEYKILGTYILRMRIRNIVYILCFLTLSLFCAKKIPFEIEPNDDFKTANIIEADRLYQGSIGSSKDVDYYMIDIAEAGSFSIYVSGIKGVNQSILIYSADNNNPVILKTIDDRRKSSEEMIKNIYLHRGRYYIAVNHGARDEAKGGNDSVYTIKVTPFTIDDRSEIEPNDTIQSATRVGIGEEILGYYSPMMKISDGVFSEEEDWYSFDISSDSESPKSITITVSAVKGISPFISLYTPDGNLVSTIKGQNENESVEMRGLGITQSGVYSLSISSPFQENHEDPYTVKVELMDVDPSGELEPNNSFDKANEVKDEFAHGFVFPEEDLDFYEYRVDSDSFYSVTCSFAGKGEGKLIIYNSRHEKISEGSTAIENGEVFIPPLLVNDLLYICVSRGDKNNQPRYGYNFKIEKIEKSDGIEIEPNNDISSAQNIIGNAITGYMNGVRDRDVFMIKEDKTVIKKITIRGVEDGVLSASFTDPYGYITRTIKVDGDKEISFRDTVDSKAFIIVDTIRESRKNGYTVTVGD